MAGTAKRAVWSGLVRVGQCGQDVSHKVSVVPVVNRYIDRVRAFWQTGRLVPSLHPRPDRSYRPVRITLYSKLNATTASNGDERCSITRNTSCNRARRRDAAHVRCKRLRRMLVRPLAPKSSHEDVPACWFDQRLRAHTLEAALLTQPANCAGKWRRL